MAMILNMFRLHWALTIAQIRRSTVQKVSVVIVILFALSLVGATGFGSYFAGNEISVHLSQAARSLAAFDSSSVGAIQIIAVFAVSTIALWTLIIQVFMIGDDNTIKSQNFTLYGIHNWQLHGGLLFSSVFSGPGVIYMLMLMAWAFAYRSLGLLPVIAALIAAFLVVLCMMSLIKMVTALLNSVLVSRRARNIFYFVAFVLYMVFLMAGNVQSRFNDDGNFVSDNFVNVCKIMVWTPIAAPLQLPVDLAVGAWWAILARLAIIAVSVVVCFAVGTWCVSQEPKLLRNAHKAVKLKGIGAFAWVPDNPAGAVSARVITSLFHDMRQTSVLFLPLLMTVYAVVSSFAKSDVNAIIGSMIGWVAYSAICMSIIESNGISYDGGGFIFNAMIGLRGIKDRLGRVVVWTTLMGVYMLAVLGVAFATILFVRHQLPSMSLMVFAVLTVISASWTSLGVAMAFAPLALYPVASVEKPFSRPRNGASGSQMFLPLLFFIIAGVLMIPTAIVGIVCAINNAQHYMWIAGVVAIVVSIIVLVIGTWLGGKFIDKRLLKIVAKLKEFAAVSQV